MLSYEKAVTYLNSFINYENVGLGLFNRDENDLERLKNILELAGDPQRSFASLHVAGTKGKGSIVSFAGNILKAHGLKTGLYTSPHLLDIRERITIDGKKILKRDFIRVSEKLMDLVSFYGHKNNKLTFFEMYTLLAILYFEYKKVDIAVFECGLGGRLDATNIIEPIVCGLSRISYDHINVLGDTIDKITGEKAGIIKNGTICITVPQKKPALDVIKKKCMEENAGLIICGKDIKCSNICINENGTEFDIETDSISVPGCRTTMLGKYQAENSAAAVGMATAAFSILNIKMYKSRIRTGILNTKLPGRLEILRENPYIIVDGAQNKDSFVELKKNIEEIFQYDKLILLLGISSDKDIRGICLVADDLADTIIVTRADTKRAASPENIAEYLHNSRNDVYVTKNVRQGLNKALSMALSGDVILAAGSLYLAGEVKSLQKKLNSR